MKLIFVRGPSLGIRTCLLVLLSILLMVLDHRQHDLKPLRALLASIAAPIQYAADAPFRIWDSVSENFTSRRALLSENAQLKTQQLFLKVELQKMLMLEQENAQLRLLLKATPTHENERKSIAQLLSVEGDAFLHEMIIDKGSRDNVYVGQPVLDADGVIGQIISVDLTTSWVMLLSDIRSAVPVVNVRTGLRGIVAGGGNSGMLSLINIPVTTDLKVGDVLVTSGLGKRYPANYPVGTISTVNRASTEHFAIVTVQMSSHSNRSQHVILLWPQVVAPKRSNHAHR